MLCQAILLPANDANGACRIMGNITPTHVIDTVNCAGDITVTWQFTDFCGREILETQAITVLHRCATMGKSTH